MSVSAPLLTVNGICLFRQLYGILGDDPPDISGTTKGRTMKFLPDVGNHKEARNQKKIDITGLVCTLQTKIPKIPIFENATFRHANLTTFCRNINMDVRNKPRKFQIDISKIGYFTEDSVRCRKKLVCKIQNGP